MKSKIKSLACLENLKQIIETDFFFELYCCAMHFNMGDKQRLIDKNYAKALKFLEIDRKRVFLSINLILKLSI